MKETERSIAIILKTIPLGESDLLVHFYTPERGRIKGVAKGARRSRRRFVNCLDVFSRVRIEYTSRRTGDLFLLESGKLEEAFPGIRAGFQAMSRASFMVELTEILFPWGVADAEMFALLQGSLERLSRSGNLEDTVMAFELRAMALGGFAIRLEACSVCGRAYRGEGRAVFDPEAGGLACLGCRSESTLYPGLSPETTRVMRRVQAGPWHDIRDVGFGAAVAGELRPVLRLHRDRRLERELRTARYLEPFS